MRTQLRRAGIRLATLVSVSALFYVASATSQSPPAKPALDVARFSTDGKLLRPADLDQWVFLGTSLGMGYNKPQSSGPGQFQVVLMEPSAYKYFIETGHYAPGSMFLLSFYDADQKRSINKAGFVQSNLTNYEIHLVDPRRAPESHAFYVFDAQDTQGNALPKGNACVTCHVGHGAFEGTFAQFYPTIRDRIPKDALERALKDHDIR
jgi:Cytochrome P460